MSSNEYVTMDDCWVYEGQNEFFISVCPEMKEKLGNVTFVDTIPIGKVLNKGGIIGIIECSNNGEWPMKSPVDAIVTRFNDRLIKKPELFGTTPEDGWIVRCKIKGVSELAQLGEVKNR
jgi:glycine cleavage system H lipoate-binding protein